MALTDILYQIDPNSMVLTIFFLITFTLLMFILRRTGIGKSNATATVISLSIALLATYGLTRTNFDLRGVFFSIGISEDLLYIIAPIMVLLFIFFMSGRKNPETGKRRFSLGKFLMILGALMMVLGFTPLIYQKAVFIGVGAGLVALGGIIANRSKFRFKKKDEKSLGNSSDPRNAERKRQQGLDYLAKAARRFRSWAIETGNPGFNGTWAMFIHWLGRGKSEAQICNDLGITQDDFVRIFNRYGKP